MKKITTILFGLLLLSEPSFGQFGQAIITDQPPYEVENQYFPHDYFVKVGMEGLLDSAVSINRCDSKVIIKNTFNDGYEGHEVRFSISSDLEIKHVQYREWTDVSDGSKINYTVEKVILSMSANPFESVLLSGHYTLQIREEYVVGELLRREGFKDTTAWRVFNGKFRVYSEQERERGRDWLIEQNEIKMGIKDSFGIYQMPDEYAAFKFNLALAAGRQN